MHLFSFSGGQKPRHGFKSILHTATQPQIAPTMPLSRPAVQHAGTGLAGQLAWLPEGRTGGLIWPGCAFWAPPAYSSLF